MSTKVYHLYVAPAASEQVGHFLAARGEVFENETQVLIFEDREYPCWLIKGNLVTLIAQCVRDLPAFQDARLFVQSDGPGKTASDVTFMLKKRNHIRETVLENLGGPSLLIKRAVP